MSADTKPHIGANMYNIGASDIDLTFRTQNNIPRTENDEKCSYKVHRIFGQPFCAHNISIRQPSGKCCISLVFKELT